MGSLELDRYHFGFMRILKEMPIFLLLSNQVLQHLTRCFRQSTADCIGWVCQQAASPGRSLLIVPLCQRLSSAHTLDVNLLDTLQVISKHCGASVCTDLLGPLISSFRMCCAGKKLWGQSEVSQN